MSIKACMTDKVKFKTIAVHEDTRQAWREFKVTVATQLAREMNNDDLAVWLLDAGRQKLSLYRGNA